jgi:hypothetical protein
MKNLKFQKELNEMSPQELICVHKDCVLDDQEHFRTSKALKVLVRQCVVERDLKSVADFYERLAMDYFSRRGWCEYEPKKYPDLTNEDMEITEEQFNIERRKIDNFIKHRQHNNTQPSLRSEEHTSELQSLRY